MTYDPDLHHRRSIRLNHHDYAGSGMYFVTICTHQRQFLFGNVFDDIMYANAYGHHVSVCWHALPDHFTDVVLDAFVVMPNHIHGIIGIATTPVGARHASPLRCHTPPTIIPTPPTPKNPTPPTTNSTTSPPSSNKPPPSLGILVGSFKSAVTRSINRDRGTPGGVVWQRNYYEHIIRNERALAHIRQYITQNPQRWKRDRNRHN